VSAGGSVAGRSGQVPKHRSFASRLLPVGPSGVVLTFDVCRTAVAVRLASRLRLRPLHLAVWPLAFFGDPMSGRFPFRRWLRPWPCIHPRGPRSRHGSGSRHDVRPPCLLPVPPPVGFFAPSALSVRGIHFPARPLGPASSRGSNPASVRLRRLLATLTVYSSPNPVTFFSHSHPWGSIPCSPLDCSKSPSARFRRIVRPCAGDGVPSGKLPVERDSGGSTFQFCRSIAGLP
jgi:hypothetical protein